MTINEYILIFKLLNIANISIPMIFLYFNKYFPVTISYMYYISAFK